MNHIVEKYFQAFSTKDLNTLSELYADDVVLNEWNENKFEGKEAVLEANKKLFSLFNEIQIMVNASGEDTQLPISLNEILVKLDDQFVRVIDVIQIRDEKINYIMAYRGF